MFWSGRRRLRIFFHIFRIFLRIPLFNVPDGRTLTRKSELIFKYIKDDNEMANAKKLESP